jgi:Transposase DDE domain
MPLTAAKAVIAGRPLFHVHGRTSPRDGAEKGVLCFGSYLYRARNVVERLFIKIKQCRRVATRYDKLAANYLEFIQLTSIRLWLRVNESTSLVALRIAGRAGRSRNSTVYQPQVLAV